MKFNQVELSYWNVKSLKEFVFIIKMNKNWNGSRLEILMNGTEIGQFFVKIIANKLICIIILL